MSNGVILSASQIASLSAEELDKHLSIAVTVDDKPAIHALAEERLSRDEFISGVSRRLGMLRQVVDLDLISRHETWRLGNYDSFYAYLAERKREYEQRGYDSDGDILVVKGYSTVLAWSNIINHFHRRHGIALDLLSYVPKSKLEVVSGACNRWDVNHDDQMDRDMYELLFDTTVTKEDILLVYAERKRRNGEQIPIADSGAEITAPAENGQSENDGGESDENGAGDAGADDAPPDDELDVTMDTETGVLLAWVRRGSGHLPLEIGRFYIKNENARDMVLNLCETWRIRLK